MPRKQTPSQATKKFCCECCGGIKSEVKNCGGDKLIINGKEEKCPLYDYRFGKGRISVKTIRKHCLMCMGGSKSGVRECVRTECPLWPFRLGTNPNYSKKDRIRKSASAKNFNLSMLGLKAKEKNISRIK